MDVLVLLAKDRVVHLVQVDVDGLLIGVEIDRTVATLVAQAGGLNAAERGTQVTDVIGIEPHHAGLHVLGKVVGALQIRGPDIGGKAVLRVICQLECLFVGIERGDSNDGAEDLFLEDSCIRLDVNEDGRLNKVAFLEAFWALTAGDQGGLLDRKSVV